MAITVEAIYENGMLRLTEALPFKEREKVQVTIRAKSSPLLDAYGIMGWKGTSADLDRLLSEIELDEEEIP